MTVQLGLTKVEVGVVPRAVLRPSLLPASSSAHRHTRIHLVLITWVGGWSILLDLGIHGFGPKLFLGQ